MCKANKHSFTTKSTKHISVSKFGLIIATKLKMSRQEEKLLRERRFKLLLKIFALNI
jgi:hypothetical protein